jgi:hypothetical protein
MSLETSLLQVDKEKKWQAQVTFLENIEDSQTIDPAIKETVAGLNLNGVNTSASCGGHEVCLERGDTPWPWILVEALDQPREKFIGELDAMQKFAESKHITLEELRHSEDQFVAIDSVSKNPLTAEYIEWENKCRQLERMVGSLLEDFYRNRQVADYVKIKIGRGIHEDVYFYVSNMIDQDLSDKASNGTLSIDETNLLVSQLADRQKEMKDFAKFLKDRFLEN